MYTILWEFLVPPRRRAEFEQAYAADGPWAELFGRADGFAGTQLLRCTEQDGRYLTVDRWRSARTTPPSSGSSAPSTRRWTPGWKGWPTWRTGSAPSRTPLRADAAAGSLARLGAPGVAADHGGSA